MRYRGRHEKDDRFLFETMQVRSDQVLKGKNISNLEFHTQGNHLSI